jgi:hypothetical protein
LKKEHFGEMFDQPHPGMTETDICGAGMTEHGYDMS